MKVADQISLTPFVFLFPRIAFLIVSFWAVVGRAGIIDSAVEKIAYGIVKQGLLANGGSEQYAECVVDFLKWQGATDDVMDLRNILQPEQLAKKLDEKANLANFVCSIGGSMIAIIVLAILMLLCCAGICSCCCSSKEESIRINLAVPANQIPYKYLDKV